MMRLARTIMAFVIALSVAWLPVAGSASIVIKSSSGAAISYSALDADMAVSMDGCCPDQTAPCDLPSSQCPSMASCAVQSVSLADVTGAGLTYLQVPGTPVPALTDQAVPLHGGSPPFRPPRV